MEKQWISVQMDGNKSTVGFSFYGYDRQMRDLPAAQSWFNELVEYVDEFYCTELVLDFSKLLLMDEHGFIRLDIFTKFLRAKGIAYAIVGLNPMMQELFNAFVRRSPIPEVYKARKEVSPQAA